MQLDLTDSQVNALLLAIDSYYADLRDEIYHTDDENMRESLRDVERTLEQIREQLEPGWMTRNGAESAEALPDSPPAS